jgi:hypothetical protein
VDCDRFYGERIFIKATPGYPPHIAVTGCYGEVYTKREKCPLDNAYARRYL